MQDRFSEQQLSIIVTVCVWNMVVDDHCFGIMYIV